MELVKKYIYAVTNKLPEQQRADIEKELHGLIEDMLEERTQGGIPTASDVEAVLLELGNPSELADKYRGSKRYLISPELFPTYIFVLKIAIAAICIATTVAFVVETVLEPAQIQGQLTSYISSIMSGIFQGFAWVTIIFFLVDYKGLNKQKLNKNSWKPSDLPPLPDHRVKIKMADPIVSISFTIILLVLLTFSINLFGVWFSPDASIRTVIPIFDEEVFRGFLPFIWVVFALNILSDIMKIILGRWTIKLIAFDIVVILLHFVLAVFMFSDSSIWNPHFLQQIAQPDLIQHESDGLQFIQTVWPNATQGVLAILGIILGIQLITTVVKYFKIKDLT
ncbi:HAAS signaling domain-containing protein [Paenibacillus segetis]|uniref:DUF1700 domain-containing protein n=1 Tax=Paenibacillus segetis TaxID=1325360 RepID=A0ABQ1YNL9_9BACL|nr:hypothetical protein [Paenibacillus segetis]GGH30738.1 hypothetical protein GCM10008013_34010 [Paenibacillus segetis]